MLSSCNLIILAIGYFALWGRDHLRGYLYLVDSKVGIKRMYIYVHPRGIGRGFIESRGFVLNGIRYKCSDLYF